MAKRLMGSEYLVLLLSAVYFVALAPFTPGFASPGNLANILATLLPLFLVAMGQTLVLIAGGIDLSVTSIMAVASVAGAAVMNSERGLLAGSPLAAPAGLLAMLFIGGGVGWLNGLAITRFRMPPFMVTLTAMMFFSGFAIWLTQSQNINNLPAAFNAVGGRTWITLLLTASVAVTVQALLSRSLWG